jgi:hypothetical protein
MPVRDVRKGGARRRYDDQLVPDAIFFVLRSGLAGVSRTLAGPPSIRR